MLIEIKNNLCWVGLGRRSHHPNPTSHNFEHKNEK